MKSLIITGLLATALLVSYLAFTSQSTDVTEEAFNLYKIKYGKTYAPEESQYRFNIFRAFYKEMIEHNSK